MHEAGLLAAAVAEALAAGEPDGQVDPGSVGVPGDAGARGSALDPGPAAARASSVVRRPVAIEIRVHDPMHVAPESARLHAELALRARGLEDVTISVWADPVTCVMCDVSNVVQAEHPFCCECGWPLPDHGGHAVDAVIRWADAGVVP